MGRPLDIARPSKFAAENESAARVGALPAVLLITRGWRAKPAAPASNATLWVDSQRGPLIREVRHRHAGAGILGPHRHAGPGQRILLHPARR
jgi:hypothetical protein